MSAPFASRPAGWRRGVLKAAAAVAVALFVFMATQDRILTDTGGPGIVPFEVAAGEQRATEILADWGERGKAAARRSLAADYPFLAAYGLFLALACGLAAERLARAGRPRLAGIGAPLAWAALAGAGCDAAENAALLATIGGETSWGPPLALAAAIPKFVLTTPGYLYALAGLVLGRRS